MKGCLDEMEQGRGSGEDEGKGYVPVNLQMVYQSGDGVVAEDRHVRESLVGATGSGVISHGRGTQAGGSLPN